MQARKFILGVCANFDGDLVTSKPNVGWKMHASTIFFILGVCASFDGTFGNIKTHHGLGNACKHESLFWVFAQQQNPRGLENACKHASLFRVFAQILMGI